LPIPASPEKSTTRGPGREASPSSELSSRASSVSRPTVTVEVAAMRYAAATAPGRSPLRPSLRWGLAISRYASPVAAMTASTSGAAQTW
jgi:hypothetical protein